MSPTAGTRTLLARVDWSTMDEGSRAAWLAGSRAPAPDADATLIVEDVRRRGEAAVRELTARFDGAQIDSLYVPDAELDAAAHAVPTTIREALEEAAVAIRRYHAAQRDRLRDERPVVTVPGVATWRRWSAIERAGCYVPGGRASYPSSVLMLCIPARLAGVTEIVVATPPRPDATVAPAVLLAAQLVGVRKVLRVGGAQAIAALAYGTASVPRVDRIFGAGNAWVTAAKRSVQRDTAIDLPAGPSECVVIADAGADPELVAADLLAQAEHGPDSLAILVTTERSMRDAVERLLRPLAERLATGERALTTLAGWGSSVLVATLDDAIEVADAVAPEHLSLQCEAADELSRRVRHAGAIFIGPWSAIAGGDYATGTNHVLPTGGAARTYGAVSVESFGRWIEVQRVDERGVPRIARVATVLAAAEGLPAHGLSLQLRAGRVATDAAHGDDAMLLLREGGKVAPYPAEPSSELLGESLGVPAETIARYDMNTLGGGPLPGAADALRDYDAARVVEYGDMAYRRLRAVLAEGLGVAPQRIVPGAGADELIRLVTTATIGPGDAVLIPTPTFGMFAVQAAVAGGRVLEVPRRDPGERQPVGELRRAAEAGAARLVWLCSPNNPTGDRYSLDEIAALASDLPAVVAVDEVYLEFAEADAGVAPDTTSAVRLQGWIPNLVVLRSLAKAYGLAGARVGYAVVPAGLAAAFDALRLPLSVAGPSEEIALAAITDRETACRRQRAMVAERRRLSEVLERLSYRTLPSVTNFVTFRPPDAAGLAARLAASGVILREYQTGPMAGWLRASVRDRAGTDRLIDTLEAVA